VFDESLHTDFRTIVLFIIGEPTTTLVVAAAPVQPLTVAVTE
jgi:hypothetical protein